MSRLNMNYHALKKNLHMLLTYSLDRFVPAILDGTKKHTIRADHHNRWRAGMPIQHWRGNPRNVKNKP